MEFILYLGNRATIVGVVSRGDDCAPFNSSGIFTNVQNIYDGPIEELRIMIARIRNENLAYIRCPDKDQLQVILSKEFFEIYIITMRKLHFDLYTTIELIHSGFGNTFWRKPIFATPPNLFECCLLSQMPFMF